MSNCWGGVYRESKPLQLGIQDSGSNAYNVVYQAAAGAMPMLTGARQVTGFSLYSPTLNIYRAPVAAGTQSRDLFVNGVRAMRPQSVVYPVRPWRAPMWNYR